MVEECSWATLITISMPLLPTTRKLVNCLALLRGSTLNVIPIIRPCVEWQLLDACCGFNVRVKTDSSKRKWSDPAQFLVAISEEREPARAMRGAGLHAHALSYGFLSDSLDFSVSYSHLRRFIVGDKNITVGTLGEWRDAIIAGLNPYASKQQRHFFGTVLIYFEHEGLGDLWSEHVKQMQSDGTFILR